MIFIIKNNFLRFLFLSMMICAIFSSCDKNKEDKDVFSLTINFEHFVDDSEITYSMDDMIYENNAGNIYSVRRVFYVISDIILYFPDNSPLVLDDFIFVNTDDSPTLLKTIDDLPALCSGLSFRLGFSSEDNIDNEYINIENQFQDNMSWPNSNDLNPLNQGGYHYMKIEGRYINNEDNLIMYHTHTGPLNGEDFSVLYPQVEFDPSASIVLKMNVNNFYNNPICDMNLFDGAFMYNLDGQNILHANGLDVFSIETE